MGGRLEKDTPLWNTVSKAVTHDQLRQLQSKIMAKMAEIWEAAAQISKGGETGKKLKHIERSKAAAIVLYERWYVRRFSLVHCNFFLFDIRQS